MLEENELPGRAAALIFPKCGRAEALAAGFSLAGYESGSEQPENARRRQEAPQRTVNAARAHGEEPVRHWSPGSRSLSCLTERARIQLLGSELHRAAQFSYSL